ncbi:hypothetical protein [Segetibacter koreensis]|uniref:glycosyl-4,4'-diaponeurosporenoate acyltransferase CrtO family protein n=1 Tax=Segetibacter koreensis TaxID=398037 RepID=UPI0003743D77|nr:hypothetical protein [Segetibacter koreensis]
MKKADETANAARIKRIVAACNVIPNVFWSVLNLTPISVFCYRCIDWKTFGYFLIVSLLSAILPKAFFNNILPGKTPAFYRKTGVAFINRFTQNGDIINKFVRKRFPGYKAISQRQNGIYKAIQQTYMLEKFHFVVFLFFFFVIIYALKNNYARWAIIIALNNIIYNIYPCLLQQYIRIRLESTRTKRKKPRNIAPLII